MSIRKVEKLYGLNVLSNQWADMNYKDVLESKIRLAWARIEYLNKADIYSRDFHNINECVKAIKFNEDLLNEI